MPSRVRPAPVRAPRPALERDRACAIAGVCTGLARHLGAPVWVLRALFVVLALCGGAGVLLYVWCWMLTPWQEGSPAPSRRVPVAWILTASAAAALPFVLADPGGYGRSGTPWPSTTTGSLALLWMLAATVAAGLWATLIDRVDPARGPRHASVVRTVAVVLLVAALAIATRRTAVTPLPWVVLAAIGVVLSATLVRHLRELSGERIRRIREEQRSAMAAHLHDSVLQTLALIQNRAGASSEAARLARAQERELRAWLYDGDSPADSDLATDLRDYAAALELDHPVRIDVVSAGLSTERASGQLAAAAREAMANAARHAGGEVSVYIEGAASGVDVFVRDHGPGFAVADIPDDRLGVRQSIIGRMQRAGGRARVRSDANGTEVHLHVGRPGPGPENGARDV